MATLVLRQSKGSPLTNTEVDANFTNLNTELGTKLTATSYTAADVLAKLITVDGASSGLDADLLDGLNTSATLPSGSDKSTVVTRDASGNTALNSLTLAGALAGTSATFSGAVSVGSITISGGSIPVSVGGTGATTASLARTNLGLVIGTDVQAYDAELAALAGLTSAADRVPYFTGSGTASLATFTSYGRSLVAVADAATARSTLGSVIGTDVQPFASILSSVSGLTTASRGMIVKSADAGVVSRSIAGTIGRIVVTNGDGAAGNPTLDCGSDVPSLAANNTWAGTTNTFNAIVATTFTQSSDMRLKQNIQTLNNPLGTVCKLRGVSYDQNGKARIGVIAQEVEDFVPQVVETDDNGFKSVAYGNIVGLLIEAIKEQQETIKELTTRLEKLEN
jgi:hypothetical protein